MFSFSDTQTRSQKSTMWDGGLLGDFAIFLQTSLIWLCKWAMWWVANGKISVLLFKPVNHKILAIIRKVLQVLTYSSSPAFYKER